jgi:hypothetical protein
VKPLELLVGAGTSKKAGKPLKGTARFPTPLEAGLGSISCGTG